jgi:RNA polymerase sigma factor (sigma-70 family)
MGRKRKWPDEKAFAYVKACYDREGSSSITRNNFLRNDPNGKMVYTLSSETRFGGWRKFLSAIIDHYGLDITVEELEKESNREGVAKRTTFTREEIKRRVLMYHEQGRDVSYSGVLEYDKDLVQSMNNQGRACGPRHHGYKNWGAVLDDLGLSGAKRISSQSKSRIVREIKDFAKKRGEGSLLQCVAEVEIPGTFQAAQKRKFFGSWIKAVEAAGYKYGPVSRLGQKFNDPEFACGSLKGDRRRKKIEAKKSKVVSVARELIGVDGQLLRDKLKDRKIVVSGVEYGFLSQVDHLYRGVNNLTRRVLAEEGRLGNNKFLASVYQRSPSREVLGLLQENVMNLIWSIARKVYDSRIKRGLPTFPVEDLVSEGFIGFEEGVRKYQEGHGTKVSTFVAEYARFAMMNANTRHYKSATRETSNGFYGDNEDAFSVVDRVVDEGQGPEDMVGNKIDSEEVFRILRPLSKKARYVMRMIYKKGMSAAEVAEDMGISTTMVHNYRNQAMGLLRAKLALRDFGERI